VGILAMASPCMLTSKGGEILPEDLKIKIREIVRSKKLLLLPCVLLTVLKRSKDKAKCKVKNENLMEEVKWK